MMGPALSHSSQATHLPSGETATNCTGFLAARNVLGSDVFGFQCLTSPDFPGSPPTLITLPSGRNTAPLTGPLCPLNSLVSWPVAVSHSLTTPSVPVVSSVAPSGA